MTTKRVTLFLIILLFVCLCVYFWRDIYNITSNRQAMIAWLAAHGSLSVVLFILIQIAQVLIAPIPGEVTGIVGGYLYGPLMGTLYSTVGLTIGSILAFVVARIFGEPFVSKLIKRETIEKYDFFLAHKGLLLSFIFFVVPGFPKDMLCYLLGLSHMRFRHFLIVCFGGRLLGTAGLSLSGSVIKDGRTSSLEIVALIGIGIVMVGLYCYRKKLLSLFHKS
ncbi:MAG: TVP38/TMEM64 family protein [Deltaproteobacteria bacterium]